MSSSTPQQPSHPMDIPRRARSGSESSEDSVGLATTPGKLTVGNSPPRVKIQHSPNGPPSPILGFFFPSSPTKATTSFFSRPFTTSSAVSDDDDAEAPGTLPAHAHARRFSSSWAKPVPTSPVSDDRGSGLLRRLSLSNAFGRPTFPGAHAGGITPPQTSPVAPTTAANIHKRPSPVPSPSPAHRMRRSATIAVPNASPHKIRSPSPMGERILKGHFDGFV